MKPTSYSILYTIILLNALFTAFNTSANNKPELNLKAAEAFMAASNYDSSIYYFNLAKDQFAKAENFAGQTKCINEIATCNMINYQYDEALLIMNQIMSMTYTQLDSGNIEWGLAYYNLGEIFKIKSDNDKSLSYYKKAVSYFMSSPDYQHKLVDTYLNLGDVFRHQSAYEKSIGQLSLALDLANNLYGVDSKMAAKIYISMSMSSTFQNNIEESVVYLSKALVILEKSSVDNTKELILVYQGLSENYRVLKDSKKSLDLMQQAVNLLDKKELSFQHISVYRDYGVLLSDFGHHKECIPFFQQSLKWAEQMLGPKHPANASILYRWATAYLFAEDFEKSLEYSQKSLIANSKSFQNEDYSSNPTNRDYFSDLLTVRALRIKSRSLTRLFQKTENSDYLKMALGTCLFGDSIVTETRRTQKALMDKIQFGFYSKSFSEVGISACQKLFELTQDKNYLDMAFQYSERAKASTVTETLSAASARLNGEIPQDLLNLESELKNQQSKTRTDLILAKKNNEKSETIEKLNAELFDWDQKIDSVNTVLEKNYPIYQTLKNNQPSIDIETVQNGISPGTVFLEFFEGTQEVFLFVISTETALLHSYPRDTVFKSTLTNFKKCFIKESLTQDPMFQFQNFNNSSSDLYALLFEEQLQELSSPIEIQELIIIPDGEFFYTPFELLISKKDTINELDYRRLNYLIKDYTFSYGYAASLLFNPQERKNQNDSFLGFAPVYSQTLDEMQLASLGKFRDEIVPLEWNQHEVESISKIAKGSFFLAENATESAFKREAKGAGIIHMAMHALIDDDEPMNSKFVFTLDDDRNEDGLLHAFELFDMAIDADLAVLSACNTGLGKLQQGEGVMSLARGFLYAGVPNMVMSLWQVSDRPTSDLMIDFYKGLENGMPYALALKNAKLNFLNRSDRITSNPFYWASFVYLGHPDKSKPDNQNSFAWLLFLGLTISVGLMLFFISKRKSV